MKKISLISIMIVIAMVLFHSCKDENDVINSDDQIIDIKDLNISETYGKSRVLGFVKDKNGDALSGVTVFFGEKSTLTDSEGKYELNEVSEGGNKRIWFRKNGYASNQKVVNVREDISSRVDANLFPIAITKNIGEDGGVISDDEFYVELPGNSFIFEDGSEVTGEVRVDVTPFLITEPEFLDAFPGEFKGTREDGSITAIESFGFIDVSLSSGGEVQLKDGIKSIIKIKAPPNNPPATIPMWHYDEIKAKWIEEGVGNLENGFYVAEVSHFTKWNWDKPYEQTAKIVGRVMGHDGSPEKNAIPIVGAKVVQKGIRYTFQNSIVTDEEGMFELLTPNGGEIEVEAFFDIYGSTKISETSPSGSGEIKDIGDILIDISLSNIMKPYVLFDTLYITSLETARILGDYFGNNKKPNYKLYLNGEEMETTKWENDLIEFIVPDNIPEFGELEIERAGYSKTIQYQEGDWTCEINGEIYGGNTISLKIIGKYIKSLPECIGHLLNLTELDLENTNLSILPGSIGNLKNLTLLDLQENKLSSLPESIGNLENLTELDLLRNELIILPESIGNLKNLTILDLRGNDLTILPESIGNLENMTYLNLGLNKLSSLPESIGNLESLTELVLLGNELISLPESIGKLKNLTEIYSWGNQLIILPESIGNLEKLTTLNLQENELNSLPESIGNLESLTYLDLWINDLTNLPESIGNLKNLTELDLMNNKLSSLPESIGNLENLTLLDLRENELNSLPESIGNLKNLKNLRLEYNQLSSLPESIGNLENLNELELVQNKLTSLPESIGNLENLTFLDLQENELNSLPESIGNLKSLKSLRLDDNQFSSLPESIKKLKDNLKNLYLDGNNFSAEEKKKVKEWLPNTAISWF